MSWLWLFVCVVSSTVGDTWSAKGMAEGGELTDFSVRGLLKILRYIVTHPKVLIGIVANAVAFVSLLALLAVAPLSFAVPATAVSYIFKTALAEWYLHERVGWRRWSGALLVAIGVFFLTT